MRNKILALLGAVCLVVLTACGSMSTDPSEVGIRYSGPVFLPQAVSFKNCQAKSAQEFGAPGDNNYLYPDGQRTLKFSNDPGSDFPPLDVSAPSPGGGQPIVMKVSGTIYFTPNFSNCDVLKDFHERIGLKYQAWNDEDGTTSDGWIKMLGVTMKDPADRAMTTAALKSTWVDLTSDADAKTTWENEVVTVLKGGVDDKGQPTVGLIKQLVGGDFFNIDNIVLQVPDLPQNVKDAINKTQEAAQNAATIQAQKTAADTFPGGPGAYYQYQLMQEAIKNGSIKVVPIPQGSPIIVGAN